MCSFCDPLWQIRRMRRILRCGTPRGWRQRLTTDCGKIVADLIARALLSAGEDCEKLSTAVDSFLNPTSSRCLQTPAQHRARAKQLRQHDPNSRAADLHELAANAIEARSRGKGWRSTRVAGAVLIVVVAFGLSSSNARAQQLAASCRAWEDRAQQAAHPDAAMVARHDQLTATAARFRAQADANYDNVPLRQGAIENEVQAEADAAAIYDWRSDLQNASGCWNDLALTQEICRDQKRRLNQLAQQLSEQPAAHFGPPHSAYILDTQSPSPPPPSPIPNSKARTIQDRRF